jgi:hypothetical protein
VTVGRRSTALVVTAAAAVGACTTSSDSDVRAAAVYEAVVRWFAERHDDDPEPLPVFIEARGEGAETDLAVQAELIDLTVDDATVRFIDAREEAVGEDEDDPDQQAVRDGGVLIRLEPVLENGPPMTLDVDEYVDETTFRTLRFTLSEDGDNWQVVGGPVDVASP